MKIIEEISSYIDNNSGIFLFGFLNSRDEYIIDCIISDILKTIKKKLSKETIHKQIKYPNSTNRKVNIDIQSQKSVICLSMNDIIEKEISDSDDKYGTFSRKILDEFRSVSIKKEISIIIKAPLYRSFGSTPSSSGYNIIGNGNTMVFSSNFYCSVCESKFVIQKNRFDNSYRSVDVNNYILPYMRDLKLSELLD